MEVIGSKQNIRLAYRNLKGNTGSKTKGTDGKTIEDISKLNDEMLIKEVRARLEDYNPLPVRRVYIPKPGSDKKRPLGIPTIWDRLIQQCILQVLEPICEPKFHNHSYGFRPNRSTHHAVSRMVSLINLGKHYYCVDIDIKGFFDNVNHGKLMKQIWNLGIRDKRLLCIISKLLKCEIEGEGIPTKGTPQGGILSPLLSNIVLNELDWWISDQWETYMPRKGNSKGFAQYARQYTNLKDGYIVRYADDMLHPSPVAVSYLWECFTECYFSKETDRIMKEWEDIRKALAHKPFNAQSETYRKFLTQIVLKIERLKEKFPYFDLQKELEQCQARLKI